MEVEACISNGLIGFDVVGLPSVAVKESRDRIRAAITNSGFPWPMLIVADRDAMLILSGNGEVIDPDDGVAAIGSGGNFALAAARALVQNTDLSAEDIAVKALTIAASICVYTNDHISVETIGG